jgi:hypothetical protein
MVDKRRGEEMSSTPAERFHLTDRFLDRRTGRPARWPGSILGRELRRNRREPESGVRQVIVGRELTWRPALSGIGYGRLHIEPQPSALPSGSGREQRTYLYNVGGSPAISARYVYRRESPGWFLSTPVDVPVHGVQTAVTGGRPLDENVAHRLLGSLGATEALAGAIFCRDFLERRWCFPISDVEHGAVLEPIVWGRGSYAPGWAASPALWEPQRGVTSAKSGRRPRQ